MHSHSKGPLFSRLMRREKALDWTLEFFRFPGCCLAARARFQRASEGVLLCLTCRFAAAVSMLKWSGGSLRASAFNWSQQQRFSRPIILFGSYLSPLLTLSPISSAHVGSDRAAETFLMPFSTGMPSTFPFLFPPQIMRLVPPPLSSLFVLVPLLPLPLFYHFICSLPRQGHPGLRGPTSSPD